MVCNGLRNNFLRICKMIDAENLLKKGVMKFGGKEKRY